MKKKFLVLTLSVMLGTTALFGCNKETTKEKNVASSDAISSDAISSDAVSSDAISLENIDGMKPLFSAIQSYMYSTNSTYNPTDDTFYYKTLIWATNSCASSNIKLTDNKNSSDMGTVSENMMNQMSASLFEGKDKVDSSKIPSDLSKQLSFDSAKKVFSVHGTDIDLSASEIVSAEPLEDDSYQVVVELLSGETKEPVATFVYKLKANSDKNSTFAYTISSVTMSSEKSDVDNDNIASDNTTNDSSKDVVSE